MQATAQTFKITPSIKREIVKIIDERIREAHVTREDFSELKSIVREIAEAQRELAEAQKRTEQRLEELAEAQKRTEQRLEELAEAQRELAEAQKRTEQRLEELAEAQRDLAEAQKRTEQRVEELAEAQKRTEEKVLNLAIGLDSTREHLGGVTRTLGYAFENEAYRMLPRLLKDRYALELKERIIRAEVGGKEINFFGKAERGGREVYIVGEARVRLDDTKQRKDVFKDIDEKVKAVKSEYGDVEIMPLLVTHFATRGILKKAKDMGIIVVQSYEWS